MFTACDLRVCVSIFADFSKHMRVFLHYPNALAIKRTLNANCLIYPSDHTHFSFFFLSYFLFDLGVNARFLSVRNVAVDPTSTLVYVADQTGNRIRKIVISSGVVT